jgi:hypothetical protein
MKKKFRNITIDGDNTWAWAYRFRGEYPELKIWKDGKIKYEKYWWSSKRYPITPRLISKFIRMNLMDQS